MRSIPSLSPFLTEKIEFLCYWIAPSLKLQPPLLPLYLAPSLPPLPPPLFLPLPLLSPPPSLPFLPPPPLPLPFLPLLPFPFIPVPLPRKHPLRLLYLPSHHPMGRLLLLHQA